MHLKGGSRDIGGVMSCVNGAEEDSLGEPGHSRESLLQEGQLVAFSGELSWSLVRWFCSSALRHKVSKMSVLVVL